MGHISYYFDCDFGRDDDSALYFVPKSCIDTMVDCYYSKFGTKPKFSSSLPLEKGDYPELYISEYLDLDGAHKH